jgi:ribosomal RNA methyltransferase Nop2
MKKQGAPEPLSEEHFANLKRKKGLPVDDIPAEARSSKKRRTSGKSEKPSKKRREETTKKGAASKPARKQANGTKEAPDASESGPKVVKGKPKKTPVTDSDEEMDDEFGASDLEVASGSDLGEETLGDDFLGSDDDSVYDSDQGNAKKEKFVFSDDEDDDDEDREEKLTAANIEGLSRKLDQKLAREAEANEAELREEALQTNIDGDKPNVLGDEDEEDELSSKTQGLLAPDLQMLRTRITETIRVLEDFSNLAEDGRSRAEYTKQLRQDVCACMFYASHYPVYDTDGGLTDYGYNEFLAEKLMYVSWPQPASR